MKRRDKKFISMVTAVALSFSIVLNGAVNTKAGQISQEDLKELLKSKISDYDKNNQKYLKNKFKSDSLDENNTKELNQEEEIRVIVQLEDAPAIEENDGADYTDSVKSSEENIKDSQVDIISKAEEITGSSVRRSFGYLVNGFSINTKRKNIDALSKIDGVKCVTEVRSYKPSMEAAKNILGAKSTWNDLGYKGEGMVVSIIDTGIDYRHKDLQKINEENTKIKKSEAESKAKELEHGQYFTDKVPYGYNYADENTNIIDDGSMHGMHVAGIVAANGDESGTSTYETVKGIAPEAQLLAMKVFTNNPDMSSAYDDDIIAAIEDSVKLGADVINMSLGSTAGFTNPDDPENAAVQRATEAGVICVISAGNSGTSTELSDWDQPNDLLEIKDTSTIGSPSTASSSLSVASMENTNLASSAMAYESTKGVKEKVEYSTPDKDSLSKLAGTFTLVDCGSGSEEDFKDKDLTGKVALIERGINTFQEKYNGAINKGAEGVIIYNHTSGGDVTIGMSISGITKPVISMGHSQGEAIKNLISEGDDTFTLSFSGDVVVSENPDIADMSQYTSWGATSDLEFKPEITAPGGDIYSLANNDSYQVMSGTSMAAPNTAGSEALIIQAVKKKFPNLSGEELVRFVKNTAMNTAKPMIDKYDESNAIPYSPRRQGAGLLNIVNAINNNVIIKYKDGKGAAALKEVDNTTKFQLTLTNYGDKEVTYTLKDEKVYGERLDDKKVIHEEVLNGSVARFDSDSVTLKKGESKVVNVTLNINSEEEKDRFVEGYLNFTSTDENVPSLSVPFMGFYGDWSAESIIDTPNYKDGKSIIGTSGLVDNEKSLYGSYTEDNQLYVDKDKVAFSPNGDKIKENVTPALYLLRNARELKVEVLDKDGNTVRELYNDEYVRKNILSDGTKPKYLGAAAWNGTIYDAKTGKYVKTEDGQYTVKVTSKIDYENAKEQVLELPVKIDTKAPEVKIQGVEKYIDNNGNSHFKLSWEAKDNEGESSIMPIFEVAVNGQAVNVDSSMVNKLEDTYSTDIPFEDGEVNEVKVAVTDYAGNIATTESKEKSVSLKTIALSGMKDEMVVGLSDLVDNKFLVKGTAGDNLKVLKINDKEVEVKDNYFTEAIELKEGENEIKVYAEDKSGKPVMDTVYKVILDTKAPDLKVQDTLTEKAPYYTTENSDLKINVEVEDKTECKVSVINKSDKDDTEKEVVLDANNKAEAEVKLVSGLNKIQLSAEDKSGNKTVKTYLVMKGDSTAKTSVTIDNLSYAEYFNESNLNNGVYTVKGHVNNKNSTLKIDGTEIKINDDLTFSYDKKVNVGRNLVNIEIIREDGSTTSYAYKIFYDTKAPSIKLDTPEQRGDSKIYVNDENFNLKGVLKEDWFGYALYVNGEKLLSGEEDPSKRGQGIEKDFEKHIKLVDGENIIKVEAVDANDNSMKQDLVVVLDKVAPTKPEIKLSTDKVTNKPVTVNLSTAEDMIDRIEYSTDGENFVKYDGEFNVGDSVTVYARTVDYAGNVSGDSTAEVKIDTTKPVVTLTGVIDGQTYYEPVDLKAEADDKDAKITVLVNGKEYNGEALDVEGDYTVEVYAEDEAGNKSDVVKKSFKLAQNSINFDGEVKHNDIKPAGDNYVFESLVDDNVKVNITDPEKGALIVTPNTKVEFGKDIVNSFGENGALYTQKVYEDNELLSSLNSIGKVFEIGVNNGEDIVDLGEGKANISFKLDKNELSAKDTSKLKVYIYDEENNKWIALESKFDNTTSTITTEASKLGKFTVAELEEEKEVTDGAVDTRDNSEKDNAAKNNTNIDKEESVANNNSVSINNKNSKITSSTKTGDSIVFAGAVAAVALVAGVIALLTRKKK
ncbi:lactocepin [Clostridium sp. DSM 8431]|uniref:S8 family serine peptidase n=1 Tax=Clostridium sp. DSM 8431 TaxID=1761781 RepID=UPI0008E0AD51|nr:S8 family serine peptidase [Clostridium sp. DSM 8431]SFU71557.1 lactocepin [Clostridium sp. DSM 8431]